MLVIVDTNLFLHYKQLDQLDWSNNGPEDITLVVLPVVLRELEKVKALGSSSRLRERASKMVAWLSKLIDNGEQVQLKRGLALRFQHREPAISFGEHDLVREVQDDQLIAGLIDLARTSTEPLAVATADVGVKVKAKSRNFTVISPREEDRLIEEPDPRERELVEVRKQLQQLQNRLPRLHVRASDGNSRLVLQRRPPSGRLPSLARVKQRYPLMGSASTFRAPLALLGSVYDVSPEQVDEYNSKLERFYTEYEAYLPVYEEWALAERCRVQVPLLLRNEGTAAASDIDIAFRFPSHLLAMTQDDEPDAPAPPPIPDKPKPRTFISSLAGRNLVGSFALPSFEPVRIHEVPDWSLDASEAAAHFHLSRLKHGTNRDIQGLVLQFPDVESLRSFTIDVSITAEELPHAAESKLNVVFAET